jgi:hypothetical protein
LHFPEKYKAYDKMSVYYEDSIAMPLTNPLTETNSEHHWFNNVCIRNYFAGFYSVAAPLPTAAKYANPAEEKMTQLNQDIISIKQLNCGKQYVSSMLITQWKDCDITLIEEPNRGAVKETRCNGQLFAHLPLPRSAIFIHTLSLD